MITVQAVSNTELNHNRQHKQLTEQQKQNNKLEAKSKLFQIALEYIMNNGGNQNANSQNI